MSRVYVYAITGESFRRRSIRGRAIEAVPVGAVYAAVDRRRSAPALTEPALQEQHAIVTELAGRLTSILPARFGAFLDERELERLVSLQGESLRRALDRVRGCAQMTVRVPLGPGAVDAVGAPSSRAGTSYLQARRAACTMPPAIDVVRAAVRGIAIDDAPSLGAGSHAVVAHLVPRSKTGAYRRAVRAALQEAGLHDRVRVTGPWPPFAFAPDLWP